MKARVSGMVVSTRIAYVRGLAEQGHSVSLKLDPTRDVFKAKIRFGDLADVVPKQARGYMVAAIDVFLAMCSAGVVNDRGHKYSSGFSNIKILMREPNVPDAFGLPMRDTTTGLVAAASASSLRTSKVLPPSSVPQPQPIPDTSAIPTDVVLPSAGPVQTTPVVSASVVLPTTEPTPDAPMASALTITSAVASVTPTLASLVHACVADTSAIVEPPSKK